MGHLRESEARVAAKARHLDGQAGSDDEDVFREARVLRVAVGILKIGHYRTRPLRKAAATRRQLGKKQILH